MDELNNLIKEHRDTFNHLINKHGCTPENAIKILRLINRYEIVLLIKKIAFEEQTDFDTVLLNLQNSYSYILEQYFAVQQLHNKPSRI